MKRASDDTFLIPSSGAASPRRPRTGEQRGEEGVEKKGGRGIKIDRGNPLFRAPLFSGARDRATMDYEIYGTGEIKG